MTDKLIFEKESCIIRAAVFEVYRQMGNGHPKAVYLECLKKEFLCRRIPFYAEYDIQLNYKGESLKHTYKIDFLCFGKIIIEIKVLQMLLEEDNAFMLNYLKGTGIKLGILANFGSYPEATVKRVVV